MKKRLLTIVVALFIGLLLAESWETKCDISFTLNQSYYSDNWDGSEISNLNWLIKSDIEANKQLTEWLRNENILKMKFGHTYESEVNQVGKQLSGWKEPTKSDDEIDMLSTGFLTFGTYLEPFVSFRVQSQFEGVYYTENLVLNPLTNQMESEIKKHKRFFEPAMLTESAGISHDFLNSERMRLDSRLGFSLREHYKYQQTTVTDGGFQSITNFSVFNKSKIVKYNSSLELYQAIYNSEEDDLIDPVTDEKIDDWKQIDVKWTNEVSIKVYEFLSFNGYAEIRYDKEIDKSGIIKQTTGLSVTYKLF